MNSNMINGLEGSQFFYGVVENRDDPMKLGRVQVRIIGLHSEFKQGNDKTGEGIPTEDLPWAYPVQSIDNAAMNGIGQSPTGMLEGTHVVGISRDGRMMNDLIILGVIGGIPQGSPNGQVGFNDPNSKYPKDDYLKEPDTNRLARAEKLNETINKLKKDTLDLEVERANELETWDEPESKYAAVYPFNHVRESESGHIIEIDDTEGAERLQTYHRTGTFEEIDPEGNKVTKIVGNDYVIIHKDNNIHIKGNLNITVEGDASILVMGNVEEQVKKNVNRVIEGNVIELIKGTLTRTIEGAVTETFKDTKTLDVTGAVSDTFQATKTLDVTGTDSETIGGSKTTDISGSQSTTASGITTDGGASIKMTAGKIDLN